MKTPPPGRTPSHRTAAVNAAARKALRVFGACDFDLHEKSVPCQAACPAGTDIPAYLEAVSRGDFASAYRINLADNIFPAVLGRVCTRPCEPACRHGRPGLGEPVAICFAKRSADDFQAASAPVVLPPWFPDSGRRVAVVGAGPAGLAAARDLRRLGHAVTVFERQPLPGGMMVRGIPAFRLPRDVVEREVAQVLAAGIELRCGIDVGRDVPMEEMVRGFDAVLVASGRPNPRWPGIPGERLRGVHAGLDYLSEVNAGRRPETGRRVVIIGGGFTAADCARVARRLGAEAVTLAYRRGPAEWRATAHELEQFQREGVAVRFHLAPLEIPGRDGAACGVRFAARVRGHNGVDWQNLPGPGEEIDADTVILATGQAPDEAWLPASRRGEPKVFFAGDVRGDGGNLIEAVGDGRRTALAIDAFLTGRERLQSAIEVMETGRPGSPRPRAWNELPRQAGREREPALRGLSDEVELGLTEESARREASRCYLCDLRFEIDNNLCIYCDRCLKVTPVAGCIVKLGELLRDADGRVTGLVPATGAHDYRQLYIDPSLCIRCGACVEVCPVDCISVRKTRRVRIPAPGGDASRPAGSGRQ